MERPGGWGKDPWRTGGEGENLGIDSSKKRKVIEGFSEGEGLMINGGRKEGFWTETIFGSGKSYL